MNFRPQLFRRVTIVGVGLIGGSIGMAIKKHGIAKEVIGLSQKQASLSYALKNNIIDQASTDPKKAVKDADFVILATPVNTIINMFPLVAAHLKRGCIMTDVGSTKINIVEAAQKHLPHFAFFVGSHPLAGSEKTGFTNATSELFTNSLCIMTPTEKTNRLAQEKVKQFWTQLGTTVKFLPPQEHDQILAYISHLPHIIAYALMEAIPQEYLTYAAQGLKDTTRVAASSAQMWSDICLSNSKNIIKSLDETIKVLSFIRKSIAFADDENLIEHFSKAKKKRDELT